MVESAVRQYLEAAEARERLGTRSALRIQDVTTSDLMETEFIKDEKVRNDGPRKSIFKGLCWLSCSSNMSMGTRLCCQNLASYRINHSDKRKNI